MTTGRGRVCRGCVSPLLTRVLDLGNVAVSDEFPFATTPVTAAETAHPLAMDLCATCGLAQLAEDDTMPAEPRGVEPRALRDQAADAVTRVAAAGWLRGATVREFGSPHGGTWLPLLGAHGFESVAGQADLVLDCFGVIHEPDQRAAFAARAAATAPDGVLLLQFHSLRAIVTGGQWNALRHGHFGYYSLGVVGRLLATAEMSVAAAWEFDLYGGTILVAAVHGGAAPTAEVIRIFADEAGLSDPRVVGGLQRAADYDIRFLRDWLLAQAALGRRVYAYGAASRAVALFAAAGVRRELLAGVADAASAKHGRRMPGTDVPIISPEELVAARPDQVLLTLPDLLPELYDEFAELRGKWVVPGVREGPIRTTAAL
ncbi:transferase [Nocardia sp. NPDC052566]|uniref:transferase n=1 Tax=Nocardia sp. NPDC052566 TaxID=3364330 RepID=UPI0037C759F2